MKNSVSQKLLLQYAAWGFSFVSVLGTLDHFFYEWSGQNRIIGLFSGTSESTWEHMKLLFFPMLIYYIFIWFRLRKLVPQALPALLTGALAGTALIPVLFYTYTGILGYMIDPVNIAIFYICAMTGFLVFYCTAKYSFPEVITNILYISTTLMACLFFLFTYSHPDLGIFIDPVTGQ